MAFLNDGIVDADMLSRPRLDVIHFLEAVNTHQEANRDFNAVNMRNASDSFDGEHGSGASGRMP